MALGTCPGRRRNRNHHPEGGGTVRRPDPDQALFRWVWADDPPGPDDNPDDDAELEPPPLRVRVRQRHGPRTMTLWGVLITLSTAPLPHEAERSVRTTPGFAGSVALGVAARPA